MKHEEMARLVERAKQGDEVAFVQIYNEFSKSVYYTGLRITKNEEDAKDIVQETMMILHENLHSIKNPKALVAYVNKVASIRCMRLLRSRRPEQIDDDFELMLQNTKEDNDEFIPEEYLEKKERREYIISCVDTLSDSQRAVTMLYYFNQLPVKQITEILEVSEAAVENRLSRARAALRAKLQTTDIKERMMSIMPLPILTRIFQTNADEVFTAEMSADIWQKIAESLKYSGEAIAATTAAVTVTSTVMGTTATSAAAEGAGAGATGAGVAAATGTTAVAAIGTATAATAVTAIVCSLAAVAVTAALWFGGVLNTDPPEYLTRGETESRITFSGGNAGVESINPTHANVWAANERGELTAHNWWITAEGSEVRLRSGEGGNVNDVLADMRAQGEYGVYILYFIVEDTAGFEYIVGRQFTLQP